ncbi:hypothetical protein THAOC_32396 [Thalassiosira oceanica]|uniref:Uncharacterized protein n=1 Tax=Thalassiosira oceanica TaxID=159749 RepID=K0R9B6_THAOC|nr:hypothetical protein THAOC_32396 [Thalassiosira oceanica]|eukprot:EJK48779.1 hypothetical protein THAOC_32396 [Thalassiosira oceanica]
MQVLDPKKKANEDATKAVKDRNKPFCEILSTYWLRMHLSADRLSLQVAKPPKKPREKRAQNLGTIKLSMTRDHVSRGSGLRYMYGSSRVPTVVWRLEARRVSWCSIWRPWTGSLGVEVGYRLWIYFYSGFTTATPLQPHLFQEVPKVVSNAQNRSLLSRFWG